MTKDKRYDVAIIGAGPGGYGAAFMAAGLGLDTCLIDPRENPGGICLYHGCIPTKALLHLAKIKHDADTANDMGIRYKEPEIDIGKVRKWKEKVVDKLTGGLGQLVRAHKIDYIRATATFTGEHSLEVEGEHVEKQKVGFENAIIAIGVKPVELPGVKIDEKTIITSGKALQMDSVPENMLIVGGGYIGLEMATIYHAMGSKISLVELTGDLMPGTDKDLIATYKKESKEYFQNIYLKTRVEKTEVKGKKCEASFKKEDGSEFKKKYDRVLVAIGQKPVTEGLGLDKLDIELTEKGFIRVDKHQQTNKKNIYAIGDIAGPPLLAHKASYEGRIAAGFIAGKKTENDARAIPAVIYTEPEIATCGLSETEAKNQNISYKIAKFPWSASGRAAAMNESAGFTKLLIDPETERILGAGIVGKNAGDLIPELVLAMEMAATAEDISLTIHPHPTLSETIMEAAEKFYGHPTHIYVKK